MTQEPPPDDPVLPPRRESLDPRHDPRHDPGHAPEAVQTLKRAMRRARFDDAERVGVQENLRATQIGRLELLQDALTPLLAQIPKNADIFDVGLMPGATPRLFVDMIGFVEMGRDARVYRLLQDTRHTRLTLAESADIETMVAAITEYVARRLLERDKALAADELLDDQAAKASLAPSRAPSRNALIVAPAAPLEEPRPVLGWAAAAFAFVIDLLGAIAFFTILAAAAWLLWNHFHGSV